MNVANARTVHRLLAARAAHMPKWDLMPDIRMLAPDDWRILHNIRLSALRESPQTFLSRYEDEQAYVEVDWRAEFIRGDWYVGIAEDHAADEPISLVGITRESRTPAHHRFLEYLWVTPEFRGRGVAFNMISLVLDRLTRSGVRTVFLWVLDGNESATRLYKRLGFISCNHRQPLKAQPGRSEELMKMDLGSDPSGSQPAGPPASPR
jgi:RimJ/RimL family protein N-acetyltransferase